LNRVSYKSIRRRCTPEIEKPRAHVNVIPGLIGGSEQTLLFFFGFHFTRLNNQRVGYKLPEVLYLDIHEVVFLPEALHDLIAAVMAGRNEQLGPGVLYLFGFHAAIKDSLLHIGRRPSAAARAAAEVVGPVGIHLHEVFAALLRNPPGLLIISMAESAFTFTAVITRIVVGGKLSVH